MSAKSRHGSPSHLLEQTILVLSFVLRNQTNLVLGSVLGNSEGAFLMKTVGFTMKNNDFGAQGWDAWGGSGGGFSER